jgi:hypothetical protein
MEESAVAVPTGLFKMTDPTQVDPQQLLAAALGHLKGPSLAATTANNGTGSLFAAAAQNQMNSLSQISTNQELTQVYSLNPAADGSAQKVSGVGGSPDTSASLLKALDSLKNK